MTDTNTENKFIRFSSDEGKIEKLKEWGLIGSKATKIKELFYKGIYSKETALCDALGYESKKTNPGCIDEYYETAFIEVNGEILKIAPAYLKQMQSKNFSVFSTEEN